MNTLRLFSLTLIFAIAILLSSRAVVANSSDSNHSLQQIQSQLASIYQSLSSLLIAVKPSDTPEAPSKKATPATPAQPALPPSDTSTPLTPALTPEVPTQEVNVQQVDKAVDSLQNQLDALWSQFQPARNQPTSEKSEAATTVPKITTTIKRGLSGDAIKQLQEFLKQFPDIYPQGLVTGYFGQATEEAVKRFQQKQGLEAAGIVESKTQAKLDEIATTGCLSSSIRPCYDKQTGKATIILNTQAGENAFKACMNNAAKSQRGESFQLTSVCTEEKFQYCFEGQSQVFLRKFEGVCKPAPPVSPVAPTSTTPTSTLNFSKVSALTKSRLILTKPGGLDFDSDGKKEFILRDFPLDSTTLYFVENTADNSFINASALTIGTGSYYPADIGDSDGDGILELLTYGRDNNFYTRLYEGTASSTYPSQVSFQIPTGWWTVGAKIDDLDKDGKKEIVFGGQDSNYLHKVQVYENTGNNSYIPVYSTTVPDIHTSQCFTTLDDIDNDGKKEMIYGGLTPDSSVMHIYENSGDNNFSEVWSYPLLYSDGLRINCGAVVYAGDMDGNGKKEFIVGGLKSAIIGDLWYAVYYVFEAIADNTFQQVAEFKKSIDASGDTSINVGDLDGDGKNEVIMTSENVAAQDQVYVFKDSGNHQFSEVWTHTWSRPATVAQWLDSVGVGDHDGDGKPELIFNEYDAGAVTTSIYERSR